MNHSRNSLKSLYLLCFPDETNESTDFIFSSLLKGSLPIVRYEGDRPVSMLFLIETHFILQDTSYPVYYLYAACTHPDFRGRGIMHGLLLEAKQVAHNNKKQGIFLRPATPSLVSFYKTAGYIPYFNYHTFEFTLPNSIVNFGEYHAIDSAKTYRSIRNALLPTLCDGFIDWGINDIKTTLQSASTLGGGALTDSIDTPSVLLLYEQNGESLFVRELLYKTEKDKDNILTYILTKTKHKKSTVRTLPKGGQSELFAMLQTENKQLLAPKHKPCYQGFAFD